MMRFVLFTIFTSAIVSAADDEKSVAQAVCQPEGKAVGEKCEGCTRVYVGTWADTCEGCTKKRHYANLHDGDSCIVQVKDGTNQCGLYDDTDMVCKGPAEPRIGYEQRVGRDVETAEQGVGRDVGTADWNYAIVRGGGGKKCSALSGQHQLAYSFAHPGVTLEQCMAKVTKEEQCWKSADGKRMVAYYAGGWYNKNGIVNGGYDCGCPTRDDCKGRESSGYYKIYEVVQPGTAFTMAPAEARDEGEDHQKGKDHVELAVAADENAHLRKINKALLKAVQEMNS